MLDMHTSNRLFFPKSKQEMFIEQLLTKATMTELAVQCDCSERTVRDWRNEKFSMPEVVVRKLCEKYKVQFPKSVKTLPAYSHTSRAGKLGGKAVVKKYGKVPTDEERRGNGWRKWWNEKGRNLPTTAISITTPKHSLLQSLLGS